MTAANHAYEVLCDPPARARVDAALRPQRARRALFAVVGASVLAVLVTVLVVRMPRPSAAVGLPALIEATREHPSDVEAWNRRWRLEAASGLTTQAAASLARALSLDPTSVELHEEHGRMAARAGDATTALAEATWLRAHGFHGRADRLTGERRTR
jgi:Flp pilus assembly protein TadD